MRKYNLIIFGATGFTGKHMIEQIIKTNRRNQSNGKSEPFSWAVAARSAEKLDQVLAEMSEITGEDLKNVPKVLADVSDVESLSAMARQCQVVINTVGPYAFYGEPVIKACIAEGTHHVDISAESHNLSQMQVLYHKEAEAKGAYIVGSCGHDSIPVECGMNYLRDNFNGELNSVTCYMYLGNHLWTNKFNFGTWSSIIRFYADFRKLRPLLRELYPDPLPKPKYKIESRCMIHRDTTGESGWSLPFPSPDVWAVEKSQNYFYKERNERPIQFANYLKQSNIFQTLAVFIGSLFLYAVLKTGRCGVYLLETFPCLFSGGLISKAGPTREQMLRFDYSFTLIGKGWGTNSARQTSAAVGGATQPPQLPEEYSEPPNKTVVVKVSGTNPAYGGTCSALLQSALTIINESDRMPSTGGVFTPATAFRDTNIVQRLREHEIKFEVLETAVL